MLQARLPPYSQEKLVVVADNRMVCPCRRHFGTQGNIVARVLYQKFPLIRGILQGVEIEGYQIVEKVTLHLASENENLRAQDVESMAVAS